ncbi:MAG TPA: flagellar biosynthesis anti-sigma factor FlgM [Desulfobaccales bacterium]
MGDNEKPKSAGDAGLKPSSQDCDAGRNGLEGLKRQAREIVYRTPEVRPEKVAQLKEAIEQGTYQIDSEKLADILIKEWFPKR